MNDDNKFAIILFGSIVIMLIVISITGAIHSVYKSVYKTEAAIKMDPVTACFAYADNTRQFEICKELKESK